MKLTRRETPSLSAEEFLRRTEEYYDLGHQKIRPQAICKDGFRVSIQHSDGHYCRPRCSGAGYYESVELGYPSKRVKEWIDWAEDPKHPKNTVYGYVPLDIVEQVIAKHGGILGALMWLKPKGE